MSDSFPDVLSEVEIHSELLAIASVCSRFCVASSPSPYDSNPFSSPYDRVFSHSPCLESCARSYQQAFKFISRSLTMERKAIRRENKKEIY